MKTIKLKYKGFIGYAKMVRDNYYLGTIITDDDYIFSYCGSFETIKIDFEKQVDLYLTKN